MWHKEFEERLIAWNQLRADCEGKDLYSALDTINAWWQNAPWQPYYLHWDDLSKWPDPWQLLADNVFCDLAKSLGMLYTVTMLNRDDHGPVELVQTKDGYNLVYFAKEKYLMNMDGEVVVNTGPMVIERRLNQQQISQQYK